jgi:hypothetical protein
MSQLIRTSISIAMLTYATLAWSGIEVIYGDWEGGDRATEAIFGTMTITKTRLTWKGRSPRERRCSVRYQQIPEGFGVRFKDQVGTEFVSAPDSPFQTFLLKIDDPKRCALGNTHFRMTLREDLPAKMLNYIEHHGLHRSIGWGHFFRPQD